MVSIIKLKPLSILTEALLGISTWVEPQLSEEIAMVRDGATVCGSVTRVGNNFAPVSNYHLGSHCATRTALK